MIIAALQPCIYDFRWRSLLFITAAAAVVAAVLVQTAHSSFD